MSSVVMLCPDHEDPVCLPTFLGDARWGGQWPFECVCIFDGNISLVCGIKYN